MVRRGDATSAASSAHAAEEAEASFHRQAEAGVRLKAQRLRQALDADRIDQAVKVAADLAAELRSPAASALSPKSYYDIYLAVASELRLLEIYVSELARRGTSVLTLYERVQETPLVLPRLYLLVSIGSVYVKSMQADAAEVLGDLVEMCAGVQHPQRGLFLRAYLLQMMKDKLPDVGNPYGRRKRSGSVNEEGAEEDLDEERSERDLEDVHDSVSFVLRNFTEMNRLWVRSQHDVAPREADIERREQERRQLRLLVGSNISTLARLQGVDLAVYKETVLPAVLDQIVSCHDAIAQEYLADCVAQVFPDEFQLATLDHFLSMCGHLVRGVNLRVILTSVIDRLARYATQSPENAAHVRKARAFETFRTHLLPMMHRQRATLLVTDRLRVFLSLARFVLKADPDNLGQIDDILGFAVQTARELASGGGAAGSDLPESGREDGGLAGSGGGSGGGGGTAVSTGFARGGRAAEGGAGVGGSANVGVVADSDRDLYSYRSRTGTGAVGSVGDEAILPGEALFSLEEEHLVVQLLTLPLDAQRSMSSALSLTNYASLQNFLRYRTRRRLAVTLLRTVQDYRPCISKVALLGKLFDYVSCLAEDPPRVDGKGEIVGPETMLSPDGMFDAASLSPHHEFILASIPGAASYVPPTSGADNPAGGGGQVRFAINGVANGGVVGSGGGGGGGFAKNEFGTNVAGAVAGSGVDANGALDDGEDDEDGYGGGGAGGEDGARNFQQGQELIARIIYFCEETDLEAAFALHVALRERLMRGGSSRAPITLPPLVMATLRLCCRAGAAAAELSMDTGIEMARNALHFVVETVDAIRSTAPEPSLRLYLQIAQTAASVYTKTVAVVAASGSEGTIAADADGVQQHVYEGLSRAFEVYESGIVSGRSQFTALELIVGSLAAVGSAPDGGQYDSLASRAVKHAQRLLTRSDQCLALLACADLYWQVGSDDDGKDVEGVGNDGIGLPFGGIDESTIEDGLGDRGNPGSSCSSGFRRRRRVGGVLVCMNGAIEAARGCVSDGERALLFVDVGQRLVRLGLSGCEAACGDSRLDLVIGAARALVEERRARSSAVGRAVATRLGRLRKLVKSKPETFARLGLRNV